MITTDFVCAKPRGEAGLAVLIVELRDQPLISFTYVFVNYINHR